MSQQVTNLASNTCQQSIFKKLFEQQIKRQFTDCSLTVGGQSISCHRNMLSAISPYFERLLTHHPDKHPMFLLEDSITTEDVDDILKFCYTGNCEIANNRVQHFLEICKKFEITGLNYPQDYHDFNETKEPIYGFLSNRNTYPVSSVIDVSRDISPHEFGLKLVVAPRKARKRSRKFQPMAMTPVDPTQSPAFFAPSEETPVLSLNQSSVLKRRKTAPVRYLNTSSSVSEEEEEQSNHQAFKCKFCPRLYSSKGAHYTHQRECDLNLNKITKQCEICNKILKPSAMSQHKKKHSVKNISASV